MSARIVWSGTRPSRYHSLRAISPPPRRPAQAIRMPSAPRRRADVTAFFIALRMDDLLDVEVDLLAGPRLELVLQLLHLRALPPDDDTRAGGRDRDPRPVGRSLDVDPRDARVVELVLDVAPDLHVLVQQRRVRLGREPP